MKQYLLLGAGTEHGRRIHVNGQQDFSDGDLVTVDIDPALAPDVLHDLESFPYPFETCQFDEIHAYECLEHCGTQGDGKFFFGQFAELWRILKTNGILAISVPKWDSEAAWGVPDHKRVLPPAIFDFLDPAYYQNVGRPGFADYRKWLGSTHFECLGKHVDEPGLRFYVVLKAIKANGANGNGS